MKILKKLAICFMLGKEPSGLTPFAFFISPSFWRSCFSKRHKCSWISKCETNINAEVGRRWHFSTIWANQVKRLTAWSLSPCLSQVAHQVGVYPSFCNMKWLGVFVLLPGRDTWTPQGTLSPSQESKLESSELKISITSSHDHEPGTIWHT